MQLSDSEWKVMRAIWRRRGPVSVRQVLEALAAETGWAYSTVKTTMSRLAEKGALAVEKRGNTSFFTPLVSSSQARRSALRALLDRAFDGTFGSLVHHMVAEEPLDETERRELLALLDEEDDR